MSETAGFYVMTEEGLLPGATVPGPPGPEGPQGAAGAAGAAGAQGEIGPQGPQGSIGETGPAGADGEDGAAGPQGPAGETGPAGPTGPAGADSTVPGPQGEVGPQGPQGIQGIPGVKGDTGDTGPAGPGVPVGGTTGQVLAKNSNTDLDTEWIDPPEGTGGGGTTVVNAAFNALGPVETFIGTNRTYANNAGNMTKVKATLSTAGTTNTVVDVKKNGVVVYTLTLGNGVNVVTNTSVVAIAENDYLTVDVTSAGTGASDLMVAVRVEE